MKYSIQSPQLHDNNDYLRDFEVMPDWKFNMKPAKDNREYITTESKPVEFKRSFTLNGIGYSFNADPFWSLYENTSANKDFYGTMQNNSAFENSPQYFPKSAGPKMSLKLVLQPNERRKWDQFRERVFQTLHLNIHDPRMLADFKDEFIEIKTGTHIRFQKIGLNIFLH